MYQYKALILDQTVTTTEIDPVTGEEVTEQNLVRSLATLDQNDILQEYDQPLMGVICLRMCDPTPSEATLVIEQPIEPLPSGWALM